MKKDKNKMKLGLRGNLKHYMVWPVYMSAILLLMTLVVYAVDAGALSQPDGDGRDGSLR